MGYQDIANFDNLYAAHLAARKNKRYAQEVMAFETDLASNLWVIKQSLDTKTYQVSGYHHFKVFDPKERDIQALGYPDRIVQHSLCDNALEPLFERRLVFDNGACRKGKGTSFVVARLSTFLREHHKEWGNRGYVLKADVTKYFANIDHVTLIGMLEKVVDDADVFTLVKNIIESFNHQERRGLPMGNMTSQWFALYYLDVMDRLIKEKLQIRFYTRYMDDMVLVHPDKDYLKECLHEMEALAHSLRLTFNDKTHIFPLQNGVEYVGWRFHVSDTGKVLRRLRTSTKKKMKKRIRHLSGLYERGIVDRQAVAHYRASVYGYLKMGNTGHLRRSLEEAFEFMK